MADAFQFNTQSGVQNSGNVGFSMPQLGIKGGNSVSGIWMPPTPADDPSKYVAFPAFLQQAFAPQIQAAKQRQYWQGYTAAAAGKSLKEIHDDQPWYSRIFGPTDYDLGASTFGVQKAASDVEQDFNNKLPELATQTSGEVASQITDMANQAMTGDPYTDALIQKNMMDRAGTMMDIHAKAHYAWQQAELAKDQSDSRLSAAGAYNKSVTTLATLGSQHPFESPTQDDVAQQQGVFLQAWQRPVDQPVQSWLKGVMSDVNTLADQGNWHAINALQQAGVFNALPPDARDKLHDQLYRASSQYQSKTMLGPLGDDVYKLQFQASVGGLSAQDVPAQVEALNKKYQAQTGDPYPLIKPAQVGQMEDRAASAWYHTWMSNIKQGYKEQAAAQTAEAKQAAAARTDASLAVAMKGGSLGDVVESGVPKQDADRIFMAGVNTSAPNVAADIIVKNFAPGQQKQPYTSSSLQTLVQNQVQRSAGQEYTDGFQTAYQSWMAMRYHTIDMGNGMSDSTSGAAASSYYYGKFNQPMQAYHDLLQQGMKPEFAYKNAFGNAELYGHGDIQGWDSASTKANQAAFQSAVSNVQPGLWHPFTPDISDSTMALLTNAASRYFADSMRNNPTLSATDAAANAITLAKANGLELAGRWGWQNASGQQSVSGWLGVGQEQFANALDTGLANKFRASGISIDKHTSLSVIRLPDDVNGPRLMAQAYDASKGVYRTINLKGKDLEEMARKNYLDQQAANRAANDPNTLVKWTQTYR